MRSILFCPKQLQSSVQTHLEVWIGYHMWHFCASVSEGRSREETPFSSLETRGDPEMTEDDSRCCWETHFLPRPPSPARREQPVPRNEAVFSCCDVVPLFRGTGSDLQRVGFEAGDLAQKYMEKVHSHVGSDPCQSRTG